MTTIGARVWSSARLATMLLIAVPACNDGLAAGDDPGSGTATLLVNADVIATPLIANAQHAADFNTAFTVDVTRAAVPVAIDSITVESDAGIVTLARDGALGIRWRGAQSGYHQIYRLTIEAGADNVRDVQVDGPALHYFSAPLPGATVDPTMPLVVTWKRSEAAPIATLETRELSSIAIGDAGTYTVPIGGLKSKDNEVEQERIRVDRAARVSPAGALVGSDVRVLVRNEVEVVVAPTGP